MVKTLLAMIRCFHSDNLTTPFDLSFVRLLVVRVAYCTVTQVPIVLGREFRLVSKANTVAAL